MSDKYDEHWQERELLNQVRQVGNRGEPIQTRPISHDEFGLVLQELVSTVEEFSKAGDGCVLIIKSSERGGYPVIQTKAHPLPAKSSRRDRDEFWESITNGEGFHTWILRHE